MIRASAPDPAGIANEFPAPDYSAHPFLDPALAQNDPHNFRAYLRTLRENLRSSWRYRRFLDRLLHPIGEEHPLEVNERIVASYLRDASAYIARMALLGDATVQPSAFVQSCNNLRELGPLLYREDRRLAFEVRRKLYLTKLLIQIDRTRRVQDGPRHKTYLEGILEKEMWAYVREAEDREVTYGVDDAGVHVGETSEGNRHAYRFHWRRVVRELAGGSYDLGIYDFKARFKRDIPPVPWVAAKAEAEIPKLERSRSASILSKMLRKQINDPVAITDMLGLRFVVGHESEVRRLASFLHEVLGGPLAFRNQVDLFHRPGDHSLMNKYSAPEYQVFKEDVDVLYAPRSGEARRPYLFGVELQIYTAESYLRTLHRRDHSSHREYKRRQAVRGVAPYLFPPEIYGSSALLRGDASSYRNDPTVAP